MDASGASEVNQPENHPEGEKMGDFLTDAKDPIFLDPFVGCLDAHTLGYG